MDSQFQCAVKICRLIESISEPLRYHVALAGGVLTKHGERKDIDIILYRKRQAPYPPRQRLLASLETHGFVIENTSGWVVKSSYLGHHVDLLFPDEPKGFRNRMAQWLGDRNHAY